jgi:hypothetical protein
MLKNVVASVLKDLGFKVDVEEAILLRLENTFVENIKGIL